MPDKGVCVFTGRTEVADVYMGVLTGTGVKVGIDFCEAAGVPISNGVGMSRACAGMAAVGTGVGAAVAESAGDPSDDWVGSNQFRGDIDVEV